MKNEKQVGLIYITVANIAEAETLARLLIEKKYADYVNIFPHTRSVYRNDNTIDISNECGMMIKTSREQVSLLIDYLKNHHPSTVPAVFD